jgi:hypothetical protein
MNFEESKGGCQPPKIQTRVERLPHGKQALACKHQLRLYHGLSWFIHLDFIIKNKN